VTNQLPENMRSKISVEVVDGCPVPGPCWVWTGCLNSRNYGCVSVGNKSIKLTHRVSYVIHKGDIPDGYHVDHLCFNTRCCNPLHLDAVTPKVNAERSRPATKSHCVNGHPLAGENLVIKRRGNGMYQRDCRVCRIDRARLQAEKEFRGMRTPSAKWAAQREARRAYLIAAGQLALRQSEGMSA
jgi:hypothetical protein